MIFLVLGSYIIASVFLFKYPKLIHRKKDVKFVARNVSHRGGAGEYYENTITAFARSLAVGSKMLELDCQLTKDKKVVVAHDNYLFRLTGLHKYISSENYVDLPQLQVSLPIDFEPGLLFTLPAEEEKDVDRNIPLLDDVFKNFVNVPINIDIKIDNDDLIKEVSQLITKYQREEITIWGNINSRITEKCYLQNPKVNLLFSKKRVCTLLLLYYTGLLPFFKLKETHLEIFLPSIYEKWPDAQNRPLLSRLVLKLMGMLLMRRSLFIHLRERGIQVYLWVLNNDEEFETAFKLDVTGVMTDYPSRLENFLNNNPHYR